MKAFWEKIETLALIAAIVIIVLHLSGCQMVAGAGRDLEWTANKCEVAMDAVVRE